MYMVRGEVPERYQAIGRWAIRSHPCMESITRDRETRVFESHADCCAFLHHIVRVRSVQQIAAELCVYTNSNFTSHELDVIEEEEGLEVATGKSTGNSEGDAGEDKGGAEEAKKVPEGSGEVGDEDEDEDKDKGNVDKTEDDPKK